MCPTWKEQATSYIWLLLLKLLTGLNHMTDATTDPITEYDTLTGERARLEKQFSERKVSQEEFGILSKQLEEAYHPAEIQAYRMAGRTDKEIAKRLRLRIYNEPLVQQIIGQLVRTHGKRLEPEFGSDRLPSIRLKQTKARRFLLTALFFNGLQISTP